jgi:DNA (cytosine-5)-methyltransferase 1
MNPAFRQTGNAVPPVMAKAIAVQMMKVLAHAGEEEMVDEPRRKTAVVSWRDPETLRYT